MAVVRSAKKKDTGSGKDEDTRVVTGDTQDGVEVQEEQSLRPQTLGDIIGRVDEGAALKVLIDAAQKRNESVDHILFHGPPGLGKTTFAHVISNEMGSKIRVTSGPAIERQGDLAAILTNLESGDVLFIDEIHRLNRGVEEVLYPAMEDFKLDIVVGKGPSARSIRLNLSRFTLIGATTRIGMLSSPLRDRFGFIQRLDYFSDDAIAEIIERVARLLEVEITNEATLEVAKRSRGTARIAQRLFRRVRDFSQVHYPGDPIEDTVAREALDTLGVDMLGLDELDRRILRTIAEKFDGGPVGLSTIAAAVSEELDTISDVYEPFLMQKGLLKRTSRGRVVTRTAYEHLGLTFPDEGTGTDAGGVKDKGKQGRLI
jgi:holliday junction DNA helicase RuvB